MKQEGTKGFGVMCYWWFGDGFNSPGLRVHSLHSTLGVMEPSFRP